MNITSREYAKTLRTFKGQADREHKVTRENHSHNIGVHTILRESLI